MERELGAEYWRKYAEEARAFAANLTTESSRQTMLRIAESYDKLADKIDKTG